jgi:hypothetical protein
MQEILWYPLLDKALFHQTGAASEAVSSKQLAYQQIHNQTYNWQSHEGQHYYCFSLEEIHSGNPMEWRVGFLKYGDHALSRAPNQRHQNGKDGRKPTIGHPVHAKELSCLFAKTRTEWNWPHWMNSPTYYIQPVRILKHNRIVAHVGVPVHLLPTWRQRIMLEEPPHLRIVGPRPVVVEGALA